MPGLSLFPSFSAGKGLARGRSRVLGGRRGEKEGVEGEKRRG